jgi:4a-hydroxytetrahydrobiopterin dehydratase
MDNVPKPGDSFKQREEMTMKLKDRSCVPCEAGTPPLDDAAVAMLTVEVPGWQAEPGQPRRLSKRYEFDDFLGAMAFVDKVAALAEEQAHHPDFCVHYSKVDVTLWTHVVGGLSENDFILASKIDAILR